MATDLLDRMNDETLSASDKAELEDMAKAVCAVTYLG